MSDILEYLEYKDEKIMLKELPNGIIGISPHNEPYQIRDMISMAYRQSDGKIFATVMSEVRIDDMTKGKQCMDGLQGLGK